MQVVGLSGRVVRPLTFDVAPGEILGFAGRPDGGVAELLRLVTGVESPRGGTVLVDGVAVQVNHPRPAIRHGIVYLSANRLVEGGLPEMTVAENLTMPLAERYWAGRNSRAAAVAWAMDALDVIPRDPTVAFGSLSGGNQQKVLLARWLLLKPRVLVLDDPTQGVDAGTRERLFSMLRGLVKGGVSVLLYSTEPEQIARMCTRVLVIQEGRIDQELLGEQLTGEEISLASFA